LKKRILVAIAVGTALLLLIVILSVVASRQAPSRHRVFRIAPAEQPAKPPGTIPPIEQWTESFQRLEPGDLADLLDRIREKQPAEYEKYSLGYLHARALIEDNEKDDASKALQPFLAANSEFRDLALYHQAELTESSALRQEVGGGGVSRARRCQCFAWRRPARRLPVAPTISRGRSTATPARRSR